MIGPGHRANILKPDFTHIGIGFLGGGRTGTYWTQLFGLSPQAPARRPYGPARRARQL
ncbi:CAP domain-containing protein [Streptomyces sp. H27-D2]|uniref:CAP domain-containing protein n=1 Tax=Streptomyces sp. H27-D2 TaxID=3046304 RepID=UPI003FA7AC3D